MRVLVVTVVHTPLDARIHARQIGALRRAGHEVTYAAPWSATDTDPAQVHQGVTVIDLPRSVGRRRVASLRAARRVLAEQGPRHDLVLLHDPELLLLVADLRGARSRFGGGPLREGVVVWDVHEDTGAALVDKAWLAQAFRPAVAWAVATVEAWAQRHLRLLLAEDRYAERLTGGPDGPHPVVPNTPMVPDLPPPGPTDPPRVVQLGRLSEGRGVQDLLEVGRLLAGEVEVHLIGQPDADVADLVRAAHERGHVTAHGFVPNDEALRLVEGAVAGLSLLHDLPNYRHSMPTKVHEYLGRAVPVVTTPLAAAVEVVTAADAGVIVPFEAPAAVVEVVRALCADLERVRVMGERGHAHVRARHAWNSDGPSFVAVLERWASPAS